MEWLGTEMPWAFKIYYLTCMFSFFLMSLNCNQTHPTFPLKNFGSQVHMMSQQANQRQQKLRSQSRRNLDQTLAHVTIPHAGCRLVIFASTGRSSQLEKMSGMQDTWRHSG